MKVITDIQAIIEIVETTWLANDGGLTMAAQDLRDFGLTVISHIKANDTEWLLDLDPWGCDTGSESNIVDLAIIWASNKE